MKQAVEILKSYWKYNTFREPQEAIINAVIGRKDVLAVLPTGSGKSLCFQVPTLMYESGVCIVISPLIALMEDQVAGLQKRGVKAVALTGNLYKDELVRIFDNIRYGKIRFLYLSPERLQNPFIQERIKDLPVSLIAVDEAHCISEWGHDFRPAYLSIAILRDLHPEVNIIALTATATTKVIQDIKDFLKLNPKIFVKPLNRENIRLGVTITHNKREAILRTIKPISDSIIIYAGTRKECVKISSFLKSKGFSAAHYHAGMTSREREISFNKWLDEEVQIMVATNAFGMGIDKSNVRLIIHSQLPYTLENYVQEVGRAGRDEKLSQAIIIEDEISIKNALENFEKMVPNVIFIRYVYKQLNQYFQIAYGDCPDKIFSFDLAAFCYRYKLPILKTYNALEVLERENILELSFEKRQLPQVRIKAGKEQLFDYYSRNPKKAIIIKSLLRTYEGISDTFSLINKQKLAIRTNISIRDLERALSEMNRDSVIDYTRSQTEATLRFLKPREDDYTINTISKAIKQRSQIKINKYKQVISYVYNNKVCRNKQLNTYFNSFEISDCGKCDVCLSKEDNKKSMSDKSIRESILNLLKKDDKSSFQICELLDTDEKSVLKQLDLLLETRTIVLISPNKYRLNES